MEQPLKQEFKFGAIYVKFEDSNASLVYDGETVDIKRQRRQVLDSAGWTADSFPQFVAEKGTDTVMKNGIQSTISTQKQCHMTENFEELRETYYSSVAPSKCLSDEIDSSVEILKPISNPSPNFYFSSTKKLFGTVIRLLEVKKRYLSYVAMNLRETVLRRSKNADKLCKTERPLESERPSAGCEIDNSNSKSPNQSDSAKGNVHSDYGSDACLHCSLQRNLTLTLEKLQECLTTALRICERMEDVLNDVRDLMSPNRPLGKRLRKALLSELKCELLLSFQVLKMQNVYASNVNKLQTLLLKLYDTGKPKDSRANEKMSKISRSAETEQRSPLKEFEESVKPGNEDQQVISEEKNGENSSSSSTLKKPEKPTCNVCVQLKFGISELHRFLDVFVKCTKILKTLDFSIIHVIYDFLEEEENSASKSLENVVRIAEEIFPKETILLKHHRDPYERIVHLAKTSDRVRASYAGKLGSIILPNGEGTLCTVDGRVIYQGEWKKGKRYGCGKAFMTCKKHAYWSAIGEYEGDWKNNCRHGSGHMVFSNGSVYDGEWEMDEIQGQGVMNRFDGCILEGFWSGGNPNGCMTFSWPHGSVEYHEYRNGDIVRVFDPRHDLSPVIQTVRCINHLREEKTYYKNCLRSLQRQFSSLANSYDKKEKRSIAQERAEKIQIVNTLQRELDLSQKTQREEVQKVEELRKRLECQICMQHPKDCLLLPCLHFNFCTMCIEKLKTREPSLKCPTCRQLTHGEIHCKFS